MSDRTTEYALTCRAAAILRAVAAGRAHTSLSCEPDLFIDGVSCCDQVTAHELARRGLIRPTRPGTPGRRVPAVLTGAGYAALHCVAQGRPVVGMLPTSA